MVLWVNFWLKKVVFLQSLIDEQGGARQSTPVTVCSHAVYCLVTSAVTEYPGSQISAKEDSRAYNAE